MRWLEPKMRRAVPLSGSRPTVRNIRPMRAAIIPLMTLSLERLIVAQRPKRQIANISGEATKLITFASCGARNMSAAARSPTNMESCRLSGIVVTGQASKPSTGFAIAHSSFPPCS